VLNAVFKKLHGYTVRQMM